MSVTYAFGIVYYLCLHAPDRSHGKAQIIAWWRALYAVLDRHIEPSSRIVLFCDSNAKIGSVSSASVGQVSPDHENFCGS